MQVMKEIEVVGVAGDVNGPGHPVSCPGSTADPATHEYLRGMLGDQDHERASRSSNRSGTSTTRAPERPALVVPHHLRTARPARAVLAYGSLLPAWTDQPLAD